MKFIYQLNSDASNGGNDDDESDDVFKYVLYFTLKLVITDWKFREHKGRRVTVDNVGSSKVAYSDDPTRCVWFYYYYIY